MDAYRDLKSIKIAKDADVTLMALCDDLSDRLQNWFHSCWIYDIDRYNQLDNVERYMYLEKTRFGLYDQSPEFKRIKNESLPTFGGHTTGLYIKWVLDDSRKRCDQPRTLMVSRQDAVIRLTHSFPRKIDEYLDGDDGYGHKRVKTNEWRFDLIEPDSIKEIRDRFFKICRWSDR